MARNFRTLSMLFEKKTADASRETIRVFTVWFSTLPILYFQQKVYVRYFKKIVSSIQGKNIFLRKGKMLFLKKKKKKNDTSTVIFQAFRNYYLVHALSSLHAPVSSCYMNLH